MDHNDPIAIDVCGEDQFCIFDFTVTERTDIASSTLEGSTKVQLVTNLSAPGSSMHENVVVSIKINT